MGNGEQSILSHVSDKVSFSIVIHMNSLLEYSFCKFSLAYFVGVVTYRTETWKQSPV